MMASKVMSLLMLLMLAMTLAATVTHALLRSELHDGGKLELIPYPVCIETCKTQCACTKIYPIEKAMCLCGDVDDDKSNIPAPLVLQKSATMLEKYSAGKKVPYKCCYAACDGCVCDRRPIDIAECICLKNTTDSKSNKPAAAAIQSIKHINAATKVEKYLSGKKIPYYCCIDTCEGSCVCDRRIPELAECVCTSAATYSILEEVEKLDKNLDLLPNANQAVKPGDFIPYPECIKKCDECNPCTLIWPIEKALCQCIIYDSSKSKKPAAIQSSGDSKQVVLWTKAKTLEAIPYDECIQTCEFCACTAIWPPEASVCVCLTPKPGTGKALPI